MIRNMTFTETIVTLHGSFSWVIPFIFSYISRLMLQITLNLQFVIIIWLGQQITILEES